MNAFLHKPDGIFQLIYQISPVPLRGEHRESHVNARWLPMPILTHSGTDSFWDYIFAESEEKSQIYCVAHQRCWTLSKVVLFSIYFRLLGFCFVLLFNFCCCCSFFLCFKVSNQGPLQVHNLVLMGNASASEITASWMEP